MPASATAGAGTVMAAVRDALAETTAYNRNEQVPPAVVLWPDKERQWEKVVPLLRASMDHLLTLGSFDAASRTGPAIWLKCMVARTLPEATWPGDTVPVLYLPGISRAELRTVEGCPPELQPLVELQYRGAWWSQVNAKDWTVTAFLLSRDGGLGLNVARDAATADALMHTLPQLMRTPVDALRDRQIDQPLLTSLVHEDPLRAVLSWLDEADDTANGDGDARAVFRTLCKKEFGFDPEADGRITAAERLGLREGVWGKVWDRFAEAPQLYARVPELLRKARPVHPTDLLFRRDSWPQDNEADEGALRQQLSALGTRSHADALREVRDLEKSHGERRGWVWAKLGDAPLAEALLHLVRLAAAVSKPLPGATRDELAESYRTGGWRADLEALFALARAGEPADFAAVKAAVRALYQPWLEQSATRLQQFLAAEPLPAAPASAAPEPEAGTCFLFVDGLRFDIGQRLLETMTKKGWEVETGWRWAALPTVTATAKPAASPVAGLLAGGAKDEKFTPAVAESGQELTADRFRQLLKARGVTYLAREETGDPDTCAWTEIGDLDRKGHDEGARLAHRVGETIRDVTARVGMLLDAGWKRIRIVTDHGWILSPGGLLKVNLPAYLVASRWGRCAVLKQSSHVELQTVPWHWNPAVQVVVAPGAAVFYEGYEYAHGGISPQECIVPEFVVTGASGPVQVATITEAAWTGFRLRVRVDGDVQDLRLDLRTKPADPSSSFVSPTPVGADGKASLLVDDDSKDGCAAVIVLLDASGIVLAKQATTVGG